MLDLVPVSIMKNSLFLQNMWKIKCNNGFGYLWPKFSTTKARLLSLGLTVLTRTERCTYNLCPNTSTLSSNLRFRAYKIGMILQSGMMYLVSNLLVTLYRRWCTFIICKHSRRILRQIVDNCSSYFVLRAYQRYVSG